MFVCPYFKDVAVQVTCKYVILILKTGSTNKTINSTRYNLKFHVLQKVLESSGSIVYDDLNSKQDWKCKTC